MSKVRKRRVVPLALIGGGVVVAALLIATRPDTGVNPDSRVDRLVRTFVATPTSHRLAITAYGTSQADQEWVAIAEVSGRVTMLAETFDDGEVLQAGTLVATIDKLDYEIRLKTAQTDVKAQQQKLLELTQSKENIQSIIDLRGQQVEFAKAEAARLQSLVEQKAGSPAAYEQAESAYIDSQSALQDLKNELAIIPIRRQAVEVALEAAELRVTQAQREIDRCEVRVPFTSLCVRRTAELHQHVAIGSELGRFQSVERSRVVAMVEARRAMGMLPKLSDSIGKIDLRRQSTSLIKELRKHFDALAIPVDLTWRAGEGVSHWRGRLARVSASIDQSTRSIPMIIEVDDAFTDIQIGIKPALVPGMFLEVMIYGDLVHDVFVVPRDVVRDDLIYVVRDGTLAIVPIHVLALEERVAVIDSGLRDGDQVVLADLFPAANGMPLRTEQVDNPVQPRLELPPLLE